MSRISAAVFSKARCTMISRVISSTGLTLDLLEEALRHADFETVDDRLGLAGGTMPELPKRTKFGPGSKS